MNRRFEHSARMWADFPTLVPGVMLIDGIAPDADVTDHVAALTAGVGARLAVSSEGEFSEVQA